MDNSLHELGTAYDTNRLLYWVTELEPDEFIVPDVWENYSKTVVNAREWINIPFPKNTTKVAVIQSNTRETVSVCTQVLKDLGYKKLAYSYGANHYKKNNPNLPDYLAKALTISLVLDWITATLVVFSGNGILIHSRALTTVLL